MLYVSICIRIWWNTFNTISLCSEIPLNQKYTAAVQSIDRGYVSASEDQEPPTNPCTRWSSRDLRSVFCAEHSITTGFTLLSFAFAQLEDEEKKNQLTVLSEIPVSETIPSLASYSLMLARASRFQIEKETVFLFAVKTVRKTLQHLVLQDDIGA